MTQGPDGPQNPHFQNTHSLNPQNLDPQSAGPRQQAGQFPLDQQQYAQQQYAQPQQGQVIYGPSYILPAGSRPEGTTDPQDLTLPLYGATMGQAVRRFFRNYLNFSGRASQSEFWWTVLFNSIITGTLVLVAVGAAVYSALNGHTVNSPEQYVIGGLIGLYGLCVLLPMLALGTRRLHDANQPGLWLLMLLVPGVGGITWLVVGLMSSNPLGVQYDYR